MKGHYFFEVSFMKKIIVIGLLCLGLFVAGASGQSIVSLDDNQGVLDLVFSSSPFVEVSWFEVLLQCDSDVSITEIKGVAVYEVFYGVPDENGYVKIAGYTIEPPVENQNTVFAKISSSGPGTINIIGAEMDDFNRQKIILDNPDIIIETTQTSTPIQTTVSTTPTQAVTQTTSVPTSEPTQNVETLQTSTPVPTGQVPLSNNPATPSPTKTSFPTVLVVLGLAGVIFMLRRTND